MSTAFIPGSFLQRTVTQAPDDGTSIEPASADLWPHAVAALKRAQAAATVHDSPAFLLGQLAATFESAGDMLKLGRVDAAIDILADVGIDDAAAKERAAHPLRVIVAEAAREPKADVVLQALHVAGGAAAVEEISKPAAPPRPAFFDCGCSRMKVRGGLCDVYDRDGKPRMGELARLRTAFLAATEGAAATQDGGSAKGVLPWCLKCNTPVEQFEADNGTRIVNGAPIFGSHTTVVVTCHGETSRHDYSAAEIRERGIPLTFFAPTSLPRTP